MDELFLSSWWKGQYIVKNHFPREVLVSSMALLVVVAFFAAILFAG